MVSRRAGTGASNVRSTASARSMVAAADVDLAAEGGAVPGQQRGGVNADLGGDDAGVQAALGQVQAIEGDLGAGLADAVEGGHEGVEVVDDLVAVRQHGPCHAQLVADKRKGNGTAGQQTGGPVRVRKRSWVRRLRARHRPGRCRVRGWCPGCRRRDRLPGRRRGGWAGQECQPV
jgi:hypothetical protein